MPPLSTTHVVPVAAGCDSARQERGDADRAGSFDEQLGPFHQQHHRVGDGVLLDDDDVVEPLLDEWSGELARSLDRDPVGEGDDGTVGRFAVGVRSARLDLHADHLDGGVVALDGDRDAGRQTAAAERHDHAPEVGHVGDQLPPERGLPGDDVEVVVGVAEDHARRGGTLASGGDRLDERVASFDQRRSVGAAGLDLRQRCTRRHEDLARARRRDERQRQPLERGCRRSRR